MLSHVAVIVGFIKKRGAATNVPISIELHKASVALLFCAVVVYNLITCDIIRDRGSDLYVGIDMVKNYCLYKWYGRCSAKKGQKLSQITPN